MGTPQNLLRSFGKDEVSSSNLDSSSSETRCPARDSGFLLCFGTRMVHHKTHTETHTDKRREQARVTFRQPFSVRPGKSGWRASYFPGQRGYTSEG